MPIRPYDRTTVQPYDHMTVGLYNCTTVQPYDGTTVQGATFNMRGQLYHRHANAMALSGGPVVSALGSESDGRRCALVTCWKKNASSALRLG